MEKGLANKEYPMYELEKLKEKLTLDGRKIFDFGTGDPKEETPLFIQQAFLNSLNSVSQYPTVRGKSELRVACANWLKRRFGVNINPDSEIIPLTGAKEGIFHITPILTEINSNKNLIIVGSPGYQVPQRSAEMFGVRLHVEELNADNAWCLDLSLIEPEVLKKAAAVWFNYPHNPTGQMVDLAFYQRQLEIAKKFDIIICSDETYVDIYQSSVKPPSFLECGVNGVLAFHSCSKRSCMTGYRTGFLAGDSNIISKYLSARSVMGLATPDFTQAAATSAWGDDEHAAKRRDLIANKKQLFEEFLKNIGVKYLQSSATFYIWCESPDHYTATSYTKKLLDFGIIVSPESHFLGKNDKYFRIALVPKLEDCIEAIEVWKEISNGGN
ncbi:MAG: aminotransferase class I/II-fold pyridoxal phosphate-dependent enzyme [Bdellovibrionales bacterium]|nr:aminotransferase class I/II-fold pyridoxal phosphate-dependent enzyme [Bdellovibrionales bacterium]